MPLAKPVSPEAKKKAFLLIALSFVSVFIYFGVIPVLHPLVQMALHIAYLVIFGVALIGYIAYNRAFSRKNITVNMLPDVWSMEKKMAYIADGEERLKKSAWLMLIIIPLLVPIGIDSLILFVWDPYLSKFMASIAGGL